MPVPFRKTPLALAVSAALFGSAAHAFDFTPVTDEFEVPQDGGNTDQTDPDVAGDADGNYVVVWDEGSNAGIFFQRFAADGTPQGSETAVPRADVSAGERNNPVVAMDVDGDFVIAWESPYFYGSPVSGYLSGVAFQRFDPDGNVVGTAQEVTAPSGPADQFLPAIAMDDDGDFVLTWEQVYDGASGAYDDIAYRAFDANGTAKTGVPDFVTQTNTTNENDSAVAMTGAGEFVITWSTGDYPTRDVFARRFAPDGTPQGTSEFLVNSITTTADQYLPDVDIDDDGDFVIAWSDRDGNNETIDARLFDWNEVPLTGELLVSSPMFAQDEPAIALRADNDFVVSWVIGAGFDGSEDGVFARAFAADGTPDTDIVQVNQATNNDQNAPRIAMDDDGDFVIAFQANGFQPNVYESEVLARQFANQPPVADAGPNQTVLSGANVTLDASGSSDPENDIASFSWTQTGGTSVSLSDSTAASPSFTAPSTADTLTFEVTVTDGEGQTDTDTVAITVNGPPVADAGPDQTVPTGAAVTLDASGSSDPEGNLASFAWTQTGGPSVSLDDPSSPMPGFTAPSSSGVLTFEVTVTDGAGQTATDAVTITVDGPPVADAGPDQTVTSGATVSLDGTGSSDPEENLVSFSWTQTGGTGVTLSDSNAADPSFTAPATASELTFELTVTDAADQSDTDTVTITVQGPQQPPVEGTSGGTGSLGWLGALWLGLAGLGRRLIGRRRTRGGGGSASILVGALALGALAGAPDAGAADDLRLAGEVESASGTVTASRDDESRRSLSPGDPVYVGDRVQTGAGASAVLRLADGTEVDLRADSEFRVAGLEGEIEQDGGGLSGLFMDLLRGGLRMVTGTVAGSDSERYRLRTPVATIGVRGTEFEARVCRRGQECPGAEESGDEPREPAARLLRLRGVVEATGANGATRVVDAGDGVYEGDTVETADNAWAVLQFADDSKVSLQPGTRFRVDEWEFERDDADDGNALLNLLRGGMRVLTGLIGDSASENYRVSTPVATIGVRGTGFDLVCVGSCINADAALGAVEGDGLFIHSWDGTAFAELEGAVAEFAAGETGFIANRVLPVVRLQSLPPALQNLTAPRPDQVLGQLPDGTDRLYTQVEDGTITVQGATGDALAVGAGSAAAVSAGGAATPVPAVGIGGTGIGAATIGAAFSALVAQQFDLATLYGGASTGRAGVDSDDDFENRIQEDFPSASVSSLSNSGIGTRVFGGVRMLEVLAFEVGYADLGELNSEIDPGSADEAAVGEDAVDKHPVVANGLDISALVRTPVNINTWAFARAGVFVWEADVSTTTPSGQTFSRSVDGTDPVVGGGVEHKIGPGLWARAEWIHYRIDPDQINFVGGGLVWTLP